LRDAGVKVALTTGFSSATQGKLLAALGWQSLADLVLAPGDGVRGRPYPDLVLTSLMRLNADGVRNVAVIGDTASDVETGLRAGAAIAAGTLTGAHNADQLRDAGATHVVVMARAHEETIKCVAKAGKDYGIGVMGDNLGCESMVDGAKRLEDLGCDYVIHHIGYDERRGIAAAGRRMPSPLDDLRAVVAAVNVPVQAVGGLTLEQAVRTPEFGAPLVVIGAPLAVDADAFRTADGNLEGTLRIICERVHGYGDVPVGKFPR
jgi:3-hexulose-6-phosphate synthase/6-phospho-3-hexuloisomerase